MAASVLSPHPPQYGSYSHLYTSQIAQYYDNLGSLQPDMLGTVPLDGTPAISNSIDDNVYHTSLDPLDTLATSTRWSSSRQLNTVQRRASRSPNILDRTPIRHNRQDTHRERSVSQSERLLPFAPSLASGSPNNQPSSHHRMPLLVPQPRYTIPGRTSPNLATYSTQSDRMVPSTIAPQYSHTTTQQNVFSSLPSNSDRQDSGFSEFASPTYNTTETSYNQVQYVIPGSSFGAQSHLPIPQLLESTSVEVDSQGSRQKPQCFDHGCSGRRFSTFSNLLRHQREKSGVASKSRCPYCGTEFTRTTAMKGHVAGGKCKGLLDPEKSPSLNENDQ